MALSTTSNGSQPTFATASAEVYSRGLMYPLGVVADDVTGVLDTCAHFAAVGRETVVCLERPIDARDTCGDRKHVDVVGLSTGSRDRDAEEASVQTQSAFEFLTECEVEGVFCKIDSLLRGPVAAMLQVFLRTAAGACVIAPALPEQGRITRAGYQWQRRNGAPPLVCGSLAEAAEAAGGDVVLISRDQVCEDGGYAAAAPYLGRPGAALIFDAETDSDLEAIVGAFQGRISTWVGTSGLGRALSGSATAAVGGLEGLDAEGLGILVVVGSATKLAKEQVEALALTMDVDFFDVGLAAERGRPPVDVTRSLQHGRTVVVVPPARLDSEPLNTQVVSEMSRVVAPWVSQAGAVVIVGGETARHLFSALHIAHLRVIGPTAHSGCLVRAASSRYPLFVTRSGSFGTRRSLIDLVGLARCQSTSKER